MISPFAPINLPVLDKDDIDIDNNFKDNDEDGQILKDDQADNQITDRRKKGTHSNS